MEEKIMCAKLMEWAKEFYKNPKNIEGFEKYMKEKEDDRQRENQTA